MQMVACFIFRALVMLILWEPCIFTKVHLHGLGLDGADAGGQLLALRGQLGLQPLVAALQLRRLPRQCLALPPQLCGIGGEIVKGRELSTHVK